MADTPSPTLDAARAASFVLLGQAASKANRRRLFVNRRTKKPFFAKSPEAVACLASYVAQLKSQWRGRPPIEGPIRLVATIVYASRRPDLDDSLLMDALQHAGVIRNDRQIWAKSLCKQIDPANPRVECSVEVIG